MHRGRAGLAGAALLLLAAAVPLMAAAEAPAALEVRCAEGKLTLAARGAPAGRVFALLGSACGVELRRAELLADRFVTAAYRGVPLEDAVLDLIRLAGVAGSLRVSTATGALTVFLMPAGAEGPAAAAAGAGAGGATAGAGGSAEARRPGEAMPRPTDGASDPERAGSAAGGDAAPAWEQALAALTRLSPDEAWVLRNLDPEDFAEERLAAAAAEARRRFLLGETENDRQDGLHALRRLDPAEAEELDAADTEQLDDLREAQVAGEARNAWLLAATPREQELALARLRQLDPFEARELEGLPAETLAEERLAAAVERAKRVYYLALAPEEQQRLFREIRKRLPE